MKPYVIGIDYGTLSGRCVLLDTRTGEEIAESVLAYAHGVMDKNLPSGRVLPERFALQHPADYLEVLRVTVPAVLGQAGVKAEEVAGVGIDFTACTLLPLDREGTPLCFDEGFADAPHAYAKLWKHHAAQEQADRVNCLAIERGETWLKNCGGKVSSEWAIPKMLEILEKAPEVWESTARFCEAGDWIVRMLTGRETHSAVFAGYKMNWSAEDGYPSNAFFARLHPKMKDLIGTRVSDAVDIPDAIGGYINDAGARLCGLTVGTPVALAMIDGHAALPALGVAGEDTMLAVLGTSGCYFVNSKRKTDVSGICGSVKDGVIPGLYTYEAGQAGMGDIYDWFVRENIPAAYTEEARARRMNIHALLREKAERLRVGESGLLALDWHNGNRSPFNDTALSGMVLGMTLGTKPEEIYRALIEATAFGTRVIIDIFRQSGISVRRMIAAGGIAKKDPMLMQIFADVLGLEIRVADSAQAGARGSAILASVAGGLYPDLPQAVEALAVPASQVYRPNPAHQAPYDRLYTEYCRLSRYFGVENTVMKRLRAIGNEKFTEN